MPAGFSSYVVLTKMLSKVCRMFVSKHPTLPVDFLTNLATENLFRLKPN